MTLPTVSILGAGAITPIGRDLPKIAARLHAKSGRIEADDAPPAPSTLEEPNSNLPLPSGERAGVRGETSDTDPHISPTDSENLPPLPTSPLREERQQLPVDDATITDAVLGKWLRRADRYTKMAVLAAADAWEAAKPALADVPLERIGLIVATGFGPHGRGFKFLDGVLDCGDSAALPTDFSHSVHGAPAGYITEILGLRGPSLSIADFVCGFEQAVQLAQCWLAEGGCDRVLVGAVEELGQVLLHCAGRMLNYDQRITPSEGAAFFMLGPAEASGAIATLTTAEVPGKVDLVLLDQPVVGLATPHLQPSETEVHWSFNASFGHHPGTAAFQILGGLLAMRPPIAIDNVATFRPSCDPAAATLLLRKITSSPTAGV